MVIIDEAQHLSYKALEELTRWPDPERHTGEAEIALVLMGNTEVYSRMRGRQEAAFACQFNRMRLPMKPLWLSTLGQLMWIWSWSGFRRKKKKQWPKRRNMAALLAMFRTTIPMVMKAGTNNPRLSYAGAIMGAGPGFTSLPGQRCNSFPRHFIWRVSQAVKTPALQAGNTGSTPVHATTCRVGGTGRHNGFKIRRLWRMGSSPILGATFKKGE